MSREKSGLSFFLRLPSNEESSDTTRDTPVFDEREDALEKAPGAWWTSLMVAVVAFHMDHTKLRATIDEEDATRTKGLHCSGDRDGSQLNPEGRRVLFHLHLP